MSQAPLSRPRSRSGAAAGAGAVLLAVAALAAIGALQPIAPTQFVLGAMVAALAGVTAIAGRVSPAWLLSLGIVFTPMAGNWEMIGFPGTLAPDRILLLAGVIATLARVPAVRDLPEPRVRTSHWLFAVYLAYAIGSAVIVGTLLSDPVFQLERMGLTAFGCFLVAPVAFARPEDRRILLWCLAGLGGYLGVLAVFEIAAPGLVFPSFITDPSVQRHLGRARGPFLEAELNGYAMFVALIAALILRAISTAPRERLIALLIIGPCALGILLTLTRTTWLGAILGGVIALAVTPRLRHLLLPAVVAGAVLVLGAFAVIPGLSDSATNRAGNQQTLWDRQNLNRAATNMLMEKPLTGHGWNRFASVANSYFFQADDYPLGIVKAKVGAHNLPLAVASELGLIGATLLLGGLLVAFWEGLTGPAAPDIQLWRVGLIALAIHYLVIMLLTPGRHLFLLITLLIWAAVCAGPRSLQPREGTA